MTDGQQPATIEQVAELRKMAEDLMVMHSNATTRSGTLRSAAMKSGGYDDADTLHNVYLDYGYPAQLDFSNFWNMYRRFGIAARVVDLPPDVCWMTHPTVEGSSAFNAALERLIERLDMWQRVEGLDTRQRVGRYAGMFMRVADNKPPSEPIEGTLSEAALVDMTPLYESQLEIVESDNDPTSEQFGQPVMIQYSQSAPGDRNEETNNTINIHASRIVFAAEGADNGWIYGIPALEPIYNSLMDLRKIVGGGAEGFYKNASQNIMFNLQDGASAISYKDKLDKFNEEYDNFSRDRFRRGMWTPGMDASVLQSTLVQPQQFFEIALNDVAAGSGIPATILIGKQTGRLASEEDSAHFLSTQQSRRENFCTPMTRDVIDWCIKYGILPASEYTVEWDDLLARSDAEKLGNAVSMADINKKQFDAGQGVPFEAEEIREAAGFDPEPEEDEGGEAIDEPFEDEGGVQEDEE